MKVLKSKTNGENAVNLECIVLKISGWKSVYRIGYFTVVWCLKVEYFNLPWIFLNDAYLLVLDSSLHSPFFWMQFHLKQSVMLPVGHLLLQAGTPNLHVMA